MATGSLQKPLLRKAPYMYDDDPLRHELAQRFDGPPVTRRSSLFETTQYVEDEEG